jgi:hypothetical protein
MRRALIAIAAAAAVLASSACADERAYEITIYEVRVQRLMEAKVAAAHECFWDYQGRACGEALVEESEAEKDFRMFHVRTPFTDDENAEIHDYVMRIANIGPKDFDHPVYTEKDYEAVK